MEEKIGLIKEQIDRLWKEFENSNAQSPTASWALVVQAYSLTWAMGVILEPTPAPKSTDSEDVFTSNILKSLGKGASR